MFFFRRDVWKTRPPGPVPGTGFPVPGIPAIAALPRVFTQIPRVFFYARGLGSVLFGSFEGRHARQFWPDRPEHVVDFLSFWCLFGVGGAPGHPRGHPLVPGRRRVSFLGGFWEAFGSPRRPFGEPGTKKQ